MPKGGKKSQRNDFGKRPDQYLGAYVQYRREFQEEKMNLLGGPANNKGHSNGPKVPPVNFVPSNMGLGAAFKPPAEEPKQKSYNTVARSFPLSTTLICTLTVNPMPLVTKYLENFEYMDFGFTEDSNQIRGRITKAYKCAEFAITFLKTNRTIGTAEKGTVLMVAEKTSGDGFLFDEMFSGLAWHMLGKNAVTGLLDPEDPTISEPAPAHPRRFFNACPDLSKDESGDLLWYYVDVLAEDSEGRIVSNQASVLASLYKCVDLDNCRAADKPIKHQNIEILSKEENRDLFNVILEYMDVTRNVGPILRYCATGICRNLLNYDALNKTKMSPQLVTRILAWKPRHATTVFECIIEQAYMYSPKCSNGAKDQPPFKIYEKLAFKTLYSLSQALNKIASQWGQNEKIKIGKLMDKMETTYKEHGDKIFKSHNGDTFDACFKIWA